MGEIPNSIGNLSQQMSELGLGDNYIAGTIPEGVKNLANLYLLAMGNNLLSGTIPSYLGKFQNLQKLSLNGNKFYGEIPASLGNITQLYSLDLADNQLEVLFWRREAKKDPFSTHSRADKLLRISYHELHQATEGFTSGNLIGSGSFGSVYKGRLNQQEEKFVAVKVLILQKDGASKSFKAEVRALRNIRHRNLVKILTYCSSIDYKGNEFKALVYEFMANGSLDIWLHPQVPESSTTLRLIQRLDIAIDVASAIHYLHDLCEPPVIHCDLKPSNILLDNDITAHVGDFGLARFLSKSTDTFAQAQTSSLGIKGTVGYAAPEYGMGGEASTYGDVYSYGVLLLEMFTGRRPTDDMFIDGLNLHNYVKMAQPNKVMNIVDPILITEGEEETDTMASGKEDEKEDDDEIEVHKVNKITESSHSGIDNIKKCIVSVIKIGLACSVESPKERMRMNHVLRELHYIKGAFLGDGIVITKQNMST
ncbi:hypothetical protein LguiA_036583 [Lonicera macranthoides]